MLLRPCLKSRVDGWVRFWHTLGRYLKTKKERSSEMKTLKIIKKISDLVTVIPLAESESDFAVVSPNKIVFALGASEKELGDLIKTEERNLPGVLSEHVLRGPYNSFPSAVTLLPTMDCNLRCEYCYARGGESKSHMPFETVANTLDAVADLNGTSELTLTFAGGGEPFLDFGVVEQSYNYAKRFFNKVSLRVITNGTFNEKEMEWLMENNVFTRISFDGVAHEKQRPFADGSSSLETVQKNIVRLVKAGYPPVIQCVVTRESISDMKRTLSYIADLGVEVIKVEPVHSSSISRADDTLTINPRKFAYELVEVVKYIVDEGLNLKLDTQFFSKPSAMPYCNADGRNIVVTPKGDVSSCVEITRKEDPYSFPFIYGQVISRGDRKEKFLINRKAVRKLSEFHFTNYSRCADCNLRLLCGGGCPIKNVWDNGFPLKPSNYVCQIEHLLLPKLLSLIATNKKVRDVLIDQASIECN